MAANTSTKEAMTFTLTSTTADTVVVSGNVAYVVLINQHATQVAYARCDGTVAVAAAEGAFLIPPAFGRLVLATMGRTISVVGNGNTITAEARPDRLLAGLS